MKFKVKKKATIIGIVFLIWITFISIDCMRINTNKPPIFSLNLEQYFDGGTKIYYGLGYKIVKYNKIGKTPEENRYELKFWFSKVDLE